MQVSCLQTMYFVHDIKMHLIIIPATFKLNHADYDIHILTFINHHRTMDTVGYIGCRGPPGPLSAVPTTVSLEQTTFQMYLLMYE